MRARWTVLRALGAAAALGGLACNPYYDPCFLPQGQVADFRVLAVRADPPDATADLLGGEVEQVHIAVLMADVQEIRKPVTLTARLCLKSIDRRCPPGALLVAQQRAWPVARFDVDAPVQLLRAALAADPLHGYGGIQLQLELFVPGQAGAADSWASKLLVYSPPGSPLNHGLEVTALRVLRNGVATGELHPGDILHLGTGETVGLRPLSGPGPGGTQAAEDYTVIDLSGAVVKLHEHISYSFYVTPDAYFGGLVDRSPANVAAASRPDLADEPDPGTPDPPDGLVQLTAIDQALGQVWVVARDGRGGEAWMSVVFSALDSGAVFSIQQQCQ